MKSTEMKRSSCKVKAARAGKNCAPRANLKPGDVTGENFIRMQQFNRWPTQETEDKYFELNNAKKPRHRPANRVKPPQLGFPLLEQADGPALQRLLVAASLSVKKVKRWPGWVLQRTYNLKNRPIEIIPDLPRRKR